MVPFAAPALERHSTIPNTRCAVVGVENPVRLQIEGSDDSDSTCVSTYFVAASLPIEDDAGYSAVGLQTAAAEHVLKSVDYIIFKEFRSQRGYCERLTQINCGGRLR